MEYKTTKRSKGTHRVAPTIELEVKTKQEFLGGLAKDPPETADENAANVVAARDGNASLLIGLLLRQHCRSAKIIDQLVLRMQNKVVNCLLKHMRRILMM